MPPSAAVLADLRLPLADGDRDVWAGFRHHSRTFSLAARLLPREVRLPVATLYLFCRAVDTVADERPAEVGRDAARAELDALEDALRRTLAGETVEGALWGRLARVHAAYGLPGVPLFQLIEGARWDLDGRTVHDEADLLRYCDLVGGTVGAMMLPFLTPPEADRDVLDADARALGVAMQLTNILRDVGEDRDRLGRLYLPATLLERFGLAALPPTPTAEYAALCEHLMTCAEVYFERGMAALPRLMPSVQGAIRAAAVLYREILNDVRAAGYDNLTRRAVVPLPRKLRLLVQDDYAARRDALVGRGDGWSAGRALYDVRGAIGG
jgi:phytoene/squalene synthetase